MDANSSFFEKLLTLIKNGTLDAIIRSRIQPWFSGLYHLPFNPKDHTITIHCPDYIQPDDEDIKISKRIYEAYRKMVADQKQAEDCYQPASLWQAQIENSFPELLGAQKDNFDDFVFFLVNFGTWKRAHYLESNTLIRKYYTNVIGRKYLEADIFYRQLKIWKWFYNNRKPVSCLSYPKHSNQSGAEIDGQFVGVGSFFNEVYGSILAELMDDVDRPVIADLGGGYGKLGYFILRDMKEFCFLDFDLPETLCMASYYLMKCFPDKKVLLYGEGEYTEKSHDEFDLIFMPSFKMTSVANGSVDLFVNKNSLGEMTKEAVEAYIDTISRATRKFFFHMNHDNIPNRYRDGGVGLLSYEYPIPEDQFKLLFRYPDLGHIIYQGWFNLKMDIFCYLYQRR